VIKLCYLLQILFGFDLNLDFPSSCHLYIHLRLSCPVGPNLGCDPAAESDVDVCEIDSNFLDCVKI